MLAFGGTSNMATPEEFENPNIAAMAKRGVTAIQANAVQFAANVLPIIRELQAAGAASANAVAAGLNARKVATARGGKWSHVHVAAVNVLRQIAEATGLQQHRGARRKAGDFVLDARRVSSL